MEQQRKVLCPAGLKDRIGRRGPKARNKAAELWVAVCTMSTVLKEGKQCEGQGGELQVAYREPCVT